MVPTDRLVVPEILVEPEIKEIMDVLDLLEVEEKKDSTDKPVILEEEEIPVQRVEKVNTVQLEELEILVTPEKRDAMETREIMVKTGMMEVMERLEELVVTVLKEIVEMMETMVEMVEQDRPVRKVQLVEVEMME